MKLKDHMAHLAKAFELRDPLEEESEGVFALPIDANRAVTIAETDTGFSLSCTVAQCPAQGREELFTQLLYADLFGQGTHGFLLGLNEEGSEITLSYDCHHELDLEEFEYMIDDFTDMVDFWEEETKNYGPRAKNTPF